MNVSKKITTGILALSLALGMASNAVAQEFVPPPADGDVKVEIISSGFLYVNISDLTDLGDYEYDRLAAQPADQGLLTITAEDGRGDASGWSVTLFGDDFNDDDEFALDNLKLTADEVRTTSTSLHSSEQQPVPDDAVPVAYTPGTHVLTAIPTTGAGNYEADYLVDLNIPAGTLVGVYTTTLTVTISGDQP